jgi:hypothetical protein
LVVDSKEEVAPFIMDKIGRVEKRVKGKIEKINRCIGQNDLIRGF